MGMPGNPGIILTTSKFGLLFITDCLSGCGAHSNWAIAREGVAQGFGSAGLSPKAVGGSSKVLTQS
jgi:hypothetical protein